MTSKQTFCVSKQVFFFGPAGPPSKAQCGPCGLFVARAHSARLARRSTARRPSLLKMFLLRISINICVSNVSPRYSSSSGSSYTKN
jgi:hypothetical protein